MNNPNDIVGHKTFSDDGLTLRHDPLTRSEADVLMEAGDRARAKRAADMPDEQAPIQALVESWYRLMEAAIKKYESDRVASGKDSG